VEGIQARTGGTHLHRNLRRPPRCPTRARCWSAGTALRAVRAECRSAWRNCARRGPSAHRCRPKSNCGRPGRRPRCCSRSATTLRFVLITSQASVTRSRANRRGDRRHAVDRHQVRALLALARRRRREPEHPTLCGRCVSNLFGPANHGRSPDGRRGSAWRRMVPWAAVAARCRADRPADQERHRRAFDYGDVKPITGEQRTSYQPGSGRESYNHGRRI